MQTLVKQGRRWFAVPHPFTRSLTDRIANRSQCKGNWDKVAVHHATAHVIANYHPMRK